MKTNILVIDDEIHMCETLQGILESDDYAVHVCDTARKGLKIIANEPIHLVISDIRMAGMDGMAFLTEMKNISPSIPIIMITAFGNVKLAVEAMKKGAFDYLTKPFDPEELLVSVSKALVYENLMRENMSLKKEMSSLYNLADIVGDDRLIRKLKDMIVKIAPTDSTVLIEGESGTGKELVAHSLHTHSQRATKPFVAINCAAFTETLLESELFGHEKGAFTGAQGLKKGKLELADGGSIYLDEIGDMSLALQSKLLRALQEKIFFRVGGTEPVHADVRVIAATNKNLREEIEQGIFREDLYYRLNVINLKVPPLRHRGNDIQLLVNAFIKEMQHKYPMTKIFHISDPVWKKIFFYEWPGNVRELRNVIERAFILGGEQEILHMLQDRPRRLRKGQDLLNKNFNEAVEAFKKDLITHVLNESKWRMNKAAEKLGISRHSLRYQMESLGIEEEG